MILIFTIISFIGTILLVVLFNNFTDFEFHSFNFWFVIPVGALFIGAGASSGLFYGHLWQNKPVFKKIYLFAFIIGISALYSIYYITYITTYVTSDKKINHSFKGDPISNYEIDGSQITFKKYLQLIQQSAKHQFYYDGNPIGESYQLGETVNKIYFWFQIIGAGLGSISIGFITLGDKEYCLTCKKYKKEKGLFTFDLDEYEKVLQDFERLINNPSELKNLIKNTSLKQEEINAYAFVELCYCPVCFDGKVHVRIMKKGSDSSYEEVRKLRYIFIISPEQSEMILKTI